MSGAGKGIGKEIAVLLYKLGAQVIALSRTQEDLDALHAAIPNVIAIKVDLENGKSASSFLASPKHVTVDDTRTAMEKAGDVDLLVYACLLLLFIPSQGAHEVHT